MPISAATSLHLATRPEEILANYAEMAAESGGAPRYWKNIQWEYLALADPARALAALEADPGYSLSEGGSGSRAQTLHWISALASLGTLNKEVRADTPFHAVFAKNGLNTYVAYNSGEQALVVHFTDGTVLGVAPHTMATLHGGTTTVLDIGGEGGGVISGPDPAPPTEPQGSGLRLVDGRIGFDDSAGTVTLASAAGANHDGAPQAASVFTLSGVSAHFEPGGASAFALKVDAGAGLANAIQAAVSYDFNGDGAVDRTEIYRYFATDNVAGWETYGSQGRLASASGAAMQDLVDGSVTIQAWTALGNHPIQVDIAASSLSLPFTVAGGGAAPGTPPAGPPVVPPASPVGDGLVLVGGVVGFGPERVTLASAAGTNHDGAPHGSAVFTLEGVTATRLASGATGFKLMVDAGNGVGDAVQAAISYDFDGNGSVDRTETYQYFATDDVAGWQAYSSSAGLKSVSGSAMQDLAGGTVKVDLWTAIGAHAVAVDLAASSLDLPFRFGAGSSGPPTLPPAGVLPAAWGLSPLPEAPGCSSARRVTSSSRAPAVASSSTGRMTPGSSPCRGCTGTTTAAAPGSTCRWTQDRASATARSSASPSTSTATGRWTGWRRTSTSRPTTMPVGSTTRRRADRAMCSELMPTSPAAASRRKSGTPLAARMSHLARARASSFPISPVGSPDVTYVKFALGLAAASRPISVPMPLRWKIAPLEHMVVCVAEGAVGLKDLMEYFAALEAAGASDYRKILDATHGENALSDADRAQLATYAKSYGRRGNPAPMAVVTGSAGNEAVVADVRMMLRDGRRMREFQTIHEARRWLDKADRTQKKAAPPTGRRRTS